MTCSECREEVDELTTVRVGGKNKRVCEECEETLREEAEVADAAEEAMQGRGRHEEAGLFSIHQYQPAR